ncbi:MAG: ABC-F family ATP-binding cassette domain-containing protein, partial [Firmicutes bacterium]|nr:ABC-F family ATP-binding cassette domain-containing protein [Bacillota bacterium]
MLILQNISYTHPNKNLLFTDINLTVNISEKIALIGNNGVGKSTLFKIVVGELQPSNGKISVKTKPYYVPQIFGQFNHLTISQALRIEDRLNALKEILKGNTSEENFNLLNDDWAIEERCNEALSYWQLNDLNLSQKLESLSGRQKTKIFLAGISIHQPELILLDEPSNHLDTDSRQLMYDFIQTTKSTLIVVSHDRKLLNLLDSVYELGKHGIKVYGGNYDFYKQQKQIENNALSRDIQSKEKMLRKAKEKEQKTLERQQKLDTRARKNLGKVNLPKIVSNTWRNSAERSTAKTVSVHAEKISGLSQDLLELRSSVFVIDIMKFGFDNSTLHKGKILFTAIDINFGYDNQPLWTENLNFQIISGERITLKGKNNSGKTTLIRLILGDIEPQSGTIYRADNT